LIEQKLKVLLLLLFVVVIVAAGAAVHLQKYFYCCDAAVDYLSEGVWCKTPLQQS